MLTEPTVEGVRDRLLLVRGMNDFGDLGEHAMVMMAEHARVRRYRAGELILDEGQPIADVHFVIRGEVAMRRKGLDMIVVDRGGTVGMLALIARDDHGARAVAKTDVETLEIPAEVIFDIYEEDFSFTRTALRYTCAAIVQKRGNLPFRPGSRPQPPPMGEYRERQRTLIEQIISMRESPMWAERNLDAVVDVARLMRPYRVPAGTAIWEIGEPSDSYIVMHYGHVRCANADGESVVVGGEFTFGIMDAISLQPRLYSARAETEVIGLRATIAGLLSVFETHHDLAMDLLAMLSKQLLPEPEPEPEPESD